MRTVLRILVIVLLSINSMGALAAGWGFITHPDGSAVGMNTSILKYSPFDNFLIPGIILFICNGIFSAIVLWGIFIHHRLAYLGVILQGIILYIWIAVQVVLLGFANWLHALFGFISVVLMICGYLLGRRKAPET